MMLHVFYTTLIILKIKLLNNSEQFISKLMSVMILYIYD